MNDVLTEDKPPTDIPKEEQSSGKNDKSADASPGVEAKKELTENFNKKESETTETEKEKMGKKAPAQKVVKKKPRVKAKNNKLPPGVTTKPQDKEHMDMSLIQDSSALMEAYLKVSDNRLVKKFLEPCFRLHENKYRM